MKTHFNITEIEQYKGKKLKAKVITYNKHKGFGFARTPYGKDIFISSYQVKDKKQENSLYFGSEIEFELGTFKDRVCAINIEIVEPFPQGEVLTINTTTQEFNLEIKGILKIGVSSLFNNSKDIDTEIIHSADEDYKFLYVDMKNGHTYKFFEEDFPYDFNGCDGYLNPQNTFNYIRKTYFTPVI